MWFLRLVAEVQEYWHWLQLWGLIASCKDFSETFAMTLYTSSLFRWWCDLQGRWITGINKAQIWIWLERESYHIVKGGVEITRSSWLNRALRDDEAVYWVNIGHFEAAAVGNWWCWVSRGHLCLYILHKVEVWTGVTDALRTHFIIYILYKELSSSIFQSLRVELS